MRFALFYHSVRSDWNHGNAHFLRGVLRELVALGHKVRALEPQGAWSLDNLLRDHGQAELEPFRTNYPELTVETYEPAANPVELAGSADLVIVHEWNDPQLVSRIGRHRIEGGRYKLLFHDTHHRSVSAPDEMARYDLEGYDGVLAFGVAQRVREFGIRQALGADARAILSLVIRQGLRTSAVGLILGLGGALMLTRYLESMLFGVGSRDVSVLIGVTVLLFAVAMVACYVPARRATRVDPMVALRES